MSLIEGAGAEFHQINTVLNDTATVHMYAAIESYSDAMALLLAAGGGESAALTEAANTIGDSIRSLGEVVLALQSYPDLINPFLARLGVSPVEHLYSTQTPVLPSLRSVKSAEYLTSRKTLPSLADLAQDSGRNDPIPIRRYSELGRELGRDYITTQEALGQLDSFLEMAGNALQDQKLKQEAASIRQTTNFIDQRELDEACEATAQDWATYLEQNPEAQILIPPGVSETTFEREQPKDGIVRPKSDHVVLNNILERLDLDELRGRLVAHVDELTAAPENKRIIFVDDWIVSGNQMSETLTDFVGANPNSPYLDRLEISLVIAQEEMLRNGFAPPNHSAIAEGLHKFPNTIPVQAHYIAKERLQPDTRLGVARIPIHVTSRHSVSDWGFAIPIKDMCEAIDNQRREETGKAIMHPTQVPILAQRQIAPKPPSRDSYPYVTWFRRRRK